jgi:hypothetical protein
VLLVTLVLLVVLSILGYTLSNRIAAQRHRDQYIIDYSKARYGCDSAVKYALATLDDFAPRLISRPDELDFSDLFRLSEAEYKELLADWAAKNDDIRHRSVNNFGVQNANDVNIAMDVNNSNYLSEANDISAIIDFNDPNSLKIRGPYGPPWPFVTKPAEFEIGSATVRIEVEDENAKYPIGWALLTEIEVQREALAGLETFCEWMDVNSTHIESLKKQLKEINKIKPFKLELKPITITEEKKTKTRRTRRRTRRTPRRRLTKKTIPPSVHTADFAKLFHSSLIDTEVLARPTIVSESRKESALKYIGLWASRKVNINTAPRHVLEAAFTFGGDADKIAEEIIQRRRIKPFPSIENLRKSLLKYSDSIKKCEKYITTVSRFFTIKVTAVSGVAKASTIIAITKDDKKIEKIAIISG